MNETLQKFKLDARHGTCSGCVLGDGQWERYVHMVCWLLGQREGGYVAQMALWFKEMIGGGCKHYVFSCCKLLTGLMKMGGKNIHPGWRHFTYWELGYGYTPYKEEKKMEKPIRDWLVNPIKLGGPIDQEEFERLIGIEAKKLMEEEWKCPKEYPSIDEWIRTGVWMRGHSGTGGKTTVMIDGKPKNTRRMKGVKGSLNSNENIKDMLFIPVGEVFSTKINYIKKFKLKSCFSCKFYIILQVLFHKEIFKNFYCQVFFFLLIRPVQWFKILFRYILLF